MNNSSLHQELLTNSTSAAVANSIGLPNGDINKILSEQNTTSNETSNRILSNDKNHNASSANSATIATASTTASASTTNGQNLADMSIKSDEKTKEVFERKRLTLTLNTTNITNGSAIKTIGAISEDSNSNISSLNGLTNNAASKVNKYSYSSDNMLILNNNNNSNLPITETPSVLNKDLINTLDINSLSTPIVEKYLLQFDANSSLKTPGSAIALLTPNTTSTLIGNTGSSSDNLGSSSASLFSQFFSLPNATPVEESSGLVNASNVILEANLINGPNAPKNQNSSILFFSNKHINSGNIIQAAEPGLTPTNSIMNPNSLFQNMQNNASNSNNNNNNIIINNNNNSNNTKYTMLTNVNTLTGVNSNSNANNGMLNFNPAGANSNTSNFLILQPQQQLNSATIQINPSNLLNGQTDINNNINSQQVIVKDNELQTVPVCNSLNANSITNNKNQKGINNTVFIFAFVYKLHYTKLC
jgi:hypothetical protein